MANVLSELFSDIADAIREKTGETGTMKPAQFPEKIAGIEAGSSADVCYVTFVSHDGATEYGKKAVAVGDDCADPIARGVFDTPTRESDVQYNYTFYGWATEANGGADSDALTAVTEDRTLYANFTATVRTYTITYYDDDGTVLTEKSVAYGTVPSYTPTKDGYDFAGWQPELVAVTGEASYTATWTVKATFGTATWTQITEILDAGTKYQYFSLGDTRDETITFSDGTTERVTFEIVDLAPSGVISGTRMAIMATHALNTPQPYVDSYSMSTNAYYAYSSLGAYLTDTIFAGLPTEMQDAMKTISMPYATRSQKLHIPTLSMIQGHEYGDVTTYQDRMLTAFKTGKSLIYKNADGTAVNYWSASSYNNSDYTKIYATYIGTNGSENYDSSSHAHSRYIVLLFFV